MSRERSLGKKGFITFEFLSGAHHKLTRTHLQRKYALRAKAANPFYSSSALDRSNNLILFNLMCERFRGITHRKMINEMKNAKIPFHHYSRAAQSASPPLLKYTLLTIDLYSFSHEL